MAKKQKLPAELKKKPKSELTTFDFSVEKQKYIDNVREIVENTDFLMLKCGTTWWINNNALLQMQYFKERLARRDNYWDENQLQEAFEMLIEITNILNQKVRYQPQIGDFCRIIGITQSTFNQWTYENNDRGEQARMIQDYFKSMLLQGMAVGEINPVAGSFIGKTSLGMKEDSGQQINVNVIGNDISLEQILSDWEKRRKN